MFLFEPTQCYSISDYSFKLSKHGLAIVQYDNKVIELIEDFPIHLSLVADKLCIGTLKFDFVAHKHNLPPVDLILEFNKELDRQILNLKEPIPINNLTKIELMGSPFSISVSKKNIHVIIPG